MLEVAPRLFCRVRSYYRMGQGGIGGHRVVVRTRCLQHVQYCFDGAGDIRSNFSEALCLCHTTRKSRDMSEIPAGLILGAVSCRFALLVPSSVHPCAAAWSPLHGL